MWSCAAALAAFFAALLGGRFGGCRGDGVDELGGGFGGERWF
jgi:hypothetical protein